MSLDLFGGSAWAIGNAPREGVAFDVFLAWSMRGTPAKAAWIPSTTDCSGHLRHEERETDLQGGTGQPQSNFVLDKE
jgi:hypothetical protein